MPADISRDEYLKYLEVDYSQRVVEEYGEEKGLFGRVGPTVELGEREGQARLEDYLSNQIEGLIEDKSVIEEIDREIGKVTDRVSNEVSKGKNLKK